MYNDIKKLLKHWNFIFEILDKSMTGQLNNCNQYAPHTHTSEKAAGLWGFIFPFLSRIERSANPGVTAIKIPLTAW